MTTIAKAARQVLVETGDTMLWFGDPDAWHDAYQRAGGQQTHPIKVWAAVRRALNASPDWHQRGTIRAISWSGKRESEHKVYEPVKPVLAPAASADSDAGH